eukprot:jgi/Mesvir1/3853/Mv25854-RA.1
MRMYIMGERHHQSGCSTSPAPGMYGSVWSAGSLTAHCIFCCRCIVVACCLWPPPHLLSPCDFVVHAHLVVLLCLS